MLMILKCCLKTVLGKTSMGKMPLPSPTKKCPLENCSQGKLPIIFSYLWYYFYGNFCRWVKSICIQFIFLIITNNLFILYFSIILFPVHVYIFNFHLWHLTLVIHRCWTTMLGNVTSLLKWIAKKLPSRYVAAVFCQHANVIG